MFAHNAPFERSCLSRALGSKCDIEIECSLRLARATLDSRDHKLPTVCKALGIPFRETHRAGPDARAAAHVARVLVARQGAARVLR
jgi:DNA polymerase-3 subunit epsilon